MYGWNPKYGSMSDMVNERRNEMTRRTNGGDWLGLLIGFLVFGAIGYVAIQIFTH